MGYPVVHFEVLGKDTETLKSFYGELFEWNINTDNPVGYGTVDREENLTEDGIGIGGGMMGAPSDEYEGHVTFYVQVPDIEAAMQQAEALGGARVMGPDQVPGGPVIGQIKDPEGHTIGVIQG
jgi:predicted enzyme related to lactoylglutathione lyase